MRESGTPIKNASTNPTPSPTTPRARSRNDTCARRASTHAIARSNRCHTHTDSFFFSPPPPPPPLFSPLFSPSFLLLLPLSFFFLIFFFFISLILYHTIPPTHPPPGSRPSDIL